MALSDDEPVYEPDDVPDTPAQAWAQLAMVRAERDQFAQNLRQVERDRDRYRQALLSLREDVVDDDLLRDRWHRETLAYLDRVLGPTPPEDRCP